MMVASAKAELLRTGEYPTSEQEPPPQSNVSFPGGWGSKVGSSSSSRDEPLYKLNDLQQALPRHRSSTHSGVNGSGKHGSVSISRPSRTLSEHRAGYVPPMPAYAVSASDPISTLR